MEAMGPSEVDGVVRGVPEFSAGSWSGVIRYASVAGNELFRLPVPPEGNVGSSPSESLLHSPEIAFRSGNFASQSEIVEKLWRQFFVDPSHWWDYRPQKVN